MRWGRTSWRCGGKQCRSARFWRTPGTYLTTKSKICWIIQGIFLQDQLGYGRSTWELVEFEALFDIILYTDKMISSTQVTGKSTKQTTRKRKRRRCKVWMQKGKFQLTRSNTMELVPWANIVHSQHCRPGPCLKTIAILDDSWPYFHLTLTTRHGRCHISNAHLDISRDTTLVANSGGKSALMGKSGLGPYGA